MCHLRALGLLEIRACGNVCEKLQMSSSVAVISIASNDFQNWCRPWPVSEAGIQPSRRKATARRRSRTARLRINTKELNILFDALRVMKRPEMDSMLIAL